MTESHTLEVLKLNNLDLVEENGIGILTIRRASKMNALNIETIEEIYIATEHFLRGDSLKGLIVTGEGEKAFVAGADISELLTLSPSNAKKFAERGQQVFAMLENANKPVVAAVNGYALGGGCELAMACHLRVAAPNAKFGQPEVNLGIIPGYGGTQRLTQLVGKGRAAEWMMTGDLISTTEAERFGLVNHIAESSDRLIPLCKEILQKILAKAPVAVGMVVRCVNAVYRHDVDGYQTEAEAFAECCASEDFKEGTSAFLEKRPPVFKGR